MSSSWAVVSTRSGFVSKHASLEVAVRKAATPILVPHFLAWWNGRREWRPLCVDDTIEGEPIPYTGTHRDGSQYRDVKYGPPRLLWPIVNEIGERLGYEAMAFSDYQSLVDAQVIASVMTSRRRR